MIVSDCCKAKVWAVGDKKKLAIDDPESYKKISPGATYFYQCDKCGKACGWSE